MKQYPFEKPDYQVSRTSGRWWLWGVVAGLLLAGFWYGGRGASSHVATHEINEQAVPWYARKPDVATFARAEQGDAEAQFVVGRYYMHQNNWKDAVVWYEKAAAQGHWKALNNAATAYVEGKAGVPQDRNKACSYFQAAYDISKEANIADNIALCLDDKNQNIAQAFRFRQIAAKAGSAQAQRTLGQMYATADGTAKDDTLAIYWYRQAALQGDARAMALLAGMYWNGTSFPKNSDTFLAGYILLKCAQAHQLPDDKEAFEQIRLTQNMENTDKWLRRKGHIPQQMIDAIEQKAKHDSMADILAEVDKHVPYSPPNVATE